MEVTCPRPQTEAGRGPHLYQCPLVGQEAGAQLAGAWSLRLQGSGREPDCGGALGSKVQGACGSRGQAG